MNLYLEYLKKIFQVQLTYRLNFIFFIATNFLFVFIQINVWQSLYINKSTVQGINLNEMISFVILNLLISNLTNTKIGQRIGEAINKGEIANNLSKPLNIKYYFIAEDFGEKLVHIIFSIIPICMLGAFIWNITIPSSKIHILIFLISLINGVVIMYLINYILGILAFWMETSWYIIWYLDAFKKLFAGSIVPLWFYPDTLYILSKFMPFRLISFDPISIYLEKVTIFESLNILIVQILWIICLKVIEIILWNKAQRKINIFGG